MITIAVERHELSDHSPVYDVVVADKLTLHACSQYDATMLARVLEDAIHNYTTHNAKVL